MPIYEYHCSCGADFERVLPIYRRHDVLCSCGKKAQLEISMPIPCRVAGAFKVYANDGTVLHQGQTMVSTPPPLYGWDKTS